MGCGRGSGVGVEPGGEVEIEIDFVLVVGELSAELLDFKAVDEFEFGDANDVGME